MVRTFVLVVVVLIVGASGLEWISRVGGLLGFTGTEMIERDAQRELTLWNQEECYTKALQHFEKDCNLLTKPEIDKIAVMMTNCLAKQLKYGTYHCDMSMTLDQCMDQWEDNPFMGAPYATMQSNVQNVCFHIKRRYFEHGIATTVDSLIENSVKVSSDLGEMIHAHGVLTQTTNDISSTLDQTGKTLQDIHQDVSTTRETMGSLATQITSIDTLQSTIAETIRTFFSYSKTQFSSIETSQAQIKDYQEQTRDHLRSIFESTQKLAETAASQVEIQQRILQKSREHEKQLDLQYKQIAEMKEFQQAVLGEFMTFKTIIMYGLLSFFTGIVTSHPKVIDARIPSFFMLIISLIIERFGSAYVDVSFVRWVYAAVFVCTVYLYARWYIDPHKSVTKLIGDLRVDLENRCYPSQAAGRRKKL